MITAVGAGMYIYYDSQYISDPLHIYIPKKYPPLEEMIGQMIMVGFLGTNTPGDIRALIEEEKLGGVMLSGHNITNPQQLQNLTASLQDISSNPLLISIDAEGGTVMRLNAKNGFGHIAAPSAEFLGKTDISATKIFSSNLSEQLQKHGVNLNFAPVVDVNIHPQSPAIGAQGRSYSSDPDIVVDHAAVFIQEHTTNNIITSLKHYPGHGSATTDSHLGITDISATYQAEKELYPFQELVRKNAAQTVMIAHVIDKRVDDLPASISSKHLYKLRRDIGFNGVTLSDDMQMGAISKNYGFKESVIKAVNADIDILLLATNETSSHSNAAQETHDIILEAIKNGDISKKTIQRSYRRIMRLKKGL